MKRKKANKQHWQVSYLINLEEISSGIISVVVGLFEPVVVVVSENPKSSPDK